MQISFLSSHSQNEPFPCVSCWRRQLSVSVCAVIRKKTTFSYDKMLLRHHLCVKCTIWARPWMFLHSWYGKMVKATTRWNVCHILCDSEASRSFCVSLQIGFAGNEKSGWLWKFARDHKKLMFDHNRGRRWIEKCQFWFEQMSNGNEWQWWLKSDNWGWELKKKSNSRKFMWNIFGLRTFLVWEHFFI